MKKIIEFLDTKKCKENIFFIAYIILLVSLMINTSKFSEIDIIKKCSHIFQILSCGIAMIKVFLDFKGEIKNKNKPKFTTIFFLMVMIISVIITKAKSIVYFAIFIIAAKDINFKKIAKITLNVQILCLIVFIVSSQLGIIENYKIRRANKIRQALGSSSPNCLMLQIFQIIGLYLYVNRDKIKLYDIIVILGMALIFYNITDSRMGMIAIIFTVVGFGIVKIKRFNIMIKKTKILFKYCSVLLAILIIVLTFVYKEFNITKLNSLLSNRLQLNVNAMEDYGITLFGSNIKWIGQTDSFKVIDENYNYVDSSYFKIMLNHGIILLGFILYCMIKIMDYSYKKEDYLLVVLLAISQVYCFFDSWLIAIQFNTFLFLLSDTLYPFKLNENKILESNTNE